MGRRAFLRRGLQAGAALGAIGLSGAVAAACGDDDAEGDGGYGTFVHQVNWYPGLGFEGSYLAAEAGVYEKLGFDGGLEMLYGGPNVSVEPVVLQGRALMGLTTSENFAGAVRQGADLVVIGAFLQRNPFCIVSMPDHPIPSLDDLAGKRIGIQAMNQTLWSAVLATAGLDESEAEAVVVQEDPAPLVNGEVDGFLSWVTVQPVVLEVFQGIEPTIVLLADHGFDLYQDLYFVTRDSLEERRDEVTAALTAEIIGKQMLLADTAAGIRLSLEKYARDQGLDPEYARLYHERSRPLCVTPTTERHGLMYMTAEDVAANLETLDLLGLEISEAEYTRTVLDAVYADGLDLLPKYDLG